MADLENPILPDQDTDDDEDLEHHAAGYTTKREPPESIYDRVADWQSQPGHVVGG
jgi:hypothetical protein